MSPATPGRRRRAARVTINDVAARAHVDPSVVSKLVNGDPGLRVRPETRRRVLAAVRETGYRPNALARSLRAARSGMLGVYVPDFADPACARVLRGAEAAAAAHGILLVPGSATGQGLRGYVDLLGRGRVDGLLVAGVLGPGVVGELARLDTPWLLLDRTAGYRRRHVLLDDERATALAVRHLTSLGHRRIAHLAARRTGGTHAGGAAAMQSLLRRSARPTGVVVPDIASATGALDAVRAAGLAVPRDLSLVLRRDLPPASDLTPSLTAVRMPFEDLGRRGVEVLVRTGAGARVEEVLSAGVELVVRGSTSPPRP